MNPYDHHHDEGIFDELRPVFKHTLVVVVLLSGLLIVAVLAEFAAHHVPNHRATLDRFEAVDFTVAFALLCIFGAHTILRTFIWAFRDLWSQCSKPLRRNK